MSADQGFTAAMVQMRTSLLPEPSLEQGIKLIREAKAQGADYVLTPEVSNMMQQNRKALFEHLATEEDDKSLKAYRALAARSQPCRRGSCGLVSLQPASGAVGRNPCRRRRQSPRWACPVTC